MMRIVQLCGLLLLGFVFGASAQDTEINLVFKGMIPPATASACNGGCGAGNGGGSIGGYAQGDGNCSWVDQYTLLTNLCLVVCGGSCPCSSGEGGNNGGFNLNMWATVVNRAGRVCAVIYSGATNTDQWPGSRAISAQKANTANAFSLPELALSSANLYGPTLPGGSLYGLQFSNPVDTSVAYGGLSENYGNPCDGTEEEDPMCDQKIGGINVFGGGLAIYISNGVSTEIVGGLGLSGDSSCADHNIAWRLRHVMNWDYVPAGVGPYYDNIIYAPAGTTPTGFEHPICSDASAIEAMQFNATAPVRTISVGKRRNTLARK